MAVNAAQVAKVSISLRIQNGFLRLFRSKSVRSAHRSGVGQLRTTFKISIWVNGDSCCFAFGGKGSQSSTWRTRCAPTKKQVERTIRPCVKVYDHSQTNLTTEILHLIRIKYDIADNVETMLPNDHNHPCWFVPSWHFIYLVVLKTEVRFFFKGLAKTVIDHYGLTPN